MKKEELKELIKLIICIILFIPCAIKDFNSNIEYIILLLIYLVSGYEVILNSIKNIIKGNIFDENFLMTIATIGAILIGKYEEAVAVMLFYNIGEFLSDKAVDSSRDSIKSLINIKAEYANLKQDNKIIKKDPKEIKINDLIVIKQGEKIPLDGIIIKGSTYLDTSAITGESVPVRKKVNDEVLSGMINLEDIIEVKVTTNYKNSTVSKILELVENATNKKSKSEKFITSFSKIYTPIVVLLSILVATILPIITNITYQESIYKALVCLVISCPCALVISIPLSYFGGIGCASKQGILIKGTNYLEQLTKLKNIIFDKTGTLTKGNFIVTKIVSNNTYSKEDILKYFAYIEYYSNHPISKSIITKYNKEIDKDKITNFKEISGKGLSCTINNLNILTGNTKLFKDNNIDIEETDEIGTIIYIAINNKYEGYIVISDEIKESSKDTINNLNNLDINTIMLTGDNNITAKKISNKLNIKEYYANLLPQDKVTKLESILSTGITAFVGDGINDAPTIRRADIGISMGLNGSDSAIEASDIVITNDEPSSIIKALKIAKKTQKIVLENITFAISIKIITLILGILGIATIWMSVLADVGVTIIAIINSLRTMKY